MTDNEIIKAFEVCRGKDLCNECAYAEDIDCLRRREKDAIDLMKRQMAEIEELTARNERQKYALKVYHIGETRKEAVKEFAERLKENFETYSDDEETNALYMTNKINDLLKEMVGEQG